MLIFAQNLRTISAFSTEEDRFKFSI